MRRFYDLNSSKATSCQPFKFSNILLACWLEIAEMKKVYGKNLYGLVTHSWLSPFFKLVFGV